MILYEMIVDEKRRLQETLQDVQSKLETLPEGRFYCVKQKNHAKWFKLDNGRLVYIKKNEEALAKQLALRKYLTQKLKDLQYELEPIEAYLTHWQKKEPQADALLADNSQYAELLRPQITSLSYELHQWSLAPYHQNTQYPERKKHQVNSTLFVRSKSEAMIATQLLAYKIPFRYECALRLNDIIIYPDFTIRHPKTGATYYLEHLGMIDQSDYIRSAASKIHLYMECGICPGENLMITKETKDNPLTLHRIQHTIQRYFW